MHFQLRQIAVLIVLIFMYPPVSPALGSIIINEVMANPLDEDTGEFIELFNAGDDPIDVLNWQFTDGDATDIIQPFRGSGTTIPANGYALILDSEYADEYELPPKVILLTTKNTTLGNGLQINDPITLFDESGTKIIDTYSHPFNPKNGISAERVDVDAGDVPENWKASIHPSGSTPGQENSVSELEVDLPPVDEPDPEETKPQPPIQQILINEIMHSPDTKAEQTEWIELFNPNLQHIDLSGWRVEDASGKSGKIPEGTQIAGGGFLILAKTKSDFQAQYRNPIEVVEIKLPALNNSGDTIILYDSFDRQVELVSYSGSGSIRGKSLERVQVSRPSNQEGNWGLSIDLAGATPGKINSRSQKVTGTSKLIIAPNPFNPQVSPTTIRYEAPTDAVITIQIFDSAGRLVRVLLEQREAGGRQSISWNGRDEDGRRVPVGVYICQLIVSGNPKKSATRVAKTVIVAEKL